MGQGRDSPLGLRLDHAARDVQVIQVLTLDDQLIVSGVEGLQNDAVAPLDIPLEGAFALVAVDQHTQVAVFQRVLLVDKGEVAVLDAGLHAVAAHDEVEVVGAEYSYDTKEHDWITSQEMGSSILRETDNMWNPVKNFLKRHKKPTWKAWDGIYIDEEEL